MLSIKQRLSKTVFPRLMRSGRVFSTATLSVRVMPKESPAASAFAFVISAKMVPTAVERNFLKRRGRHALKKNLTQVKDGYFCAFFFKKALLGLPFSVFEREIINGLKVAGLLK